VGEQHVQVAVVALRDLPACGGDLVHDLMEHDRLHDPRARVAQAGEPERVLFAALDGVQQAVGPSAALVGGRQADAVAHLVADQRQRAREQHRDQHLRPERSRGYGPVVLVDDLGDHQILEQVHAVMAVTVCGDARGLGGAVHIERADRPRLRGRRAGGVGEHLRGAEHETRADAQPAGQLLLGQRPHQRGVADQHLGLCRGRPAGPRDRDRVGDRGRRPAVR
jgi:hypothetical protein